MGNKGKNPKKNKNKGKNPQKPKNKGKNPKKPKNKVSFLIGRFPGLYTFKFPKVSFRFVISNRKIKIGRKTIRLKPSSNKKFIGWWTFPYRRVTYYIRFTSKGIRILTIKGKKVVPGKTIRKIVKPKNKGKNPKKNKNKGKNPKKNKNKGKNPKKN